MRTRSPLKTLHGSIGFWIEYCRTDDDQRLSHSLKLLDLGVDASEQGEFPSVDLPNELGGAPQARKLTNYQCVPLIELVLINGHTRW